MPDDDCSRPKLPAEIEAKIQEIAEETNASRDEVINAVLRAMFEIVDDPEKEDVPAFVKQVRQALRKKPNAAS